MAFSIRHCWLLIAVFFTFLAIIPTKTFAQPLNQKKKFTKQDTLRGSITPERSWWDVLHYHITVEPDIEKETIRGTNTIRFKTLAAGNKMQIDLQQPMGIVTVAYKGKKIPFERNGNVFYLNFHETIPAGITTEIEIQFAGKPVKAANPPWDGGWIWKKDKKGNPWVTVACQGLGASVWLPNKDHQSDEPDEGVILSIITPDYLSGVGNGRLTDEKTLPGGRKEFTWEVTSPINNYNIIPYIGNYVSWTEVFEGENGALDCSYYVLEENLEAAKIQFQQAALMLKAFEHWFGPYPFYKDGFKLVEAPHAGMEHQSAIAYGNGFKNGYFGRDVSGSGWGMKFDFILIHEAGHEWFGNNITSNDIADMWVHEGFTNYSETLYLNYHFGKEAASEYLINIRRGIRNNTPIIGPFGVNQEGSGDMYNKTGNMIHTIRQVINDDEKFRSILRGLNKNFYHQTIDGTDLIEYVNKHSGINFSPVFAQYLETTDIPVLEYAINGNEIRYRWANCIKEFDMPLKVSAGREFFLYPTIHWKTEKITDAALGEFKADENFYITTKRIAK